MPYTPTTWTEGVTALGPTNMNHLETGVSDATTTADAAIPAPAGASANKGLVYNGTSWVAATLVNANIDAAAAIAYSKLSLAGSIVNNDIASGANIAKSKLAALAIADGDVAVGAAIQPSKIANVLKTTVGTMAAGPPGSPATNDIWVATDVDSNGTVWTFRYNAAETTYKWEFIGGSSIHRADGTTRQNTSDSTWQFISGAPSFTLPRAGHYRYRIGGTFTGNNAVTAEMTIGTTAAGNLITTNVVQGSVGSVLGGNQIWNLSAIQDDIAAGTVRAANDVVGICIFSTSHTSTSWASTFLDLQPVRII